MDRNAIASAVAESLFKTEAAVDDALVQAVGLMRRMMDARRALGLPPATGDRALMRVTAAVDALGEAQREMVRTHGEMGSLGQALGLGDLGFGPLIKPLEGRVEPLPTD